MGWNKADIKSRAPNDKFREGMDNINWGKKIPKDFKQQPAVDVNKPERILTSEQKIDRMQRDAHRLLCDLRSLPDRGRDIERGPKFCLLGSQFANRYAGLYMALKSMFGGNDIADIIVRRGESSAGDPFAGDYVWHEIVREEKKN